MSDAARITSWNAIQWVQAPEVCSPNCASDCRRLSNTFLQDLFSTPLNNTSFSTGHCASRSARQTRRARRGTTRWRWGRLRWRMSRLLCSTSARGAWGAEDSWLHGDGCGLSHVATLNFLKDLLLILEDWESMGNFAQAIWDTKTAIALFKRVSWRHFAIYKSHRNSGYATMQSGIFSGPSSRLTHLLRVTCLLHVFIPKIGNNFLQLRRVESILQPQMKWSAIPDQKLELDRLESLGLAYHPWFEFSHPCMEQWRAFTCATHIYIFLIKFNVLCRNTCLNWCITLVIV